MTVLLCVIGCTGSEKFEPAPGASIDQDELQGLITQAVSDFDLTTVSFQKTPLDADSGEPTCFQVESGPCRLPAPPGLSASFHAPDGAGVLVSVKLGADTREAGQLVEQAEFGRSRAATLALRVGYEGAPVPAGNAIGPCDPEAEGTADTGCAWAERSAPKVGESAKAMKSETLAHNAFSNVSFARSSIFVDIEVVQADTDAPNKLADDLAKAMDGQIKQALSQ